MDGRDHLVHIPTTSCTAVTRSRSARVWDMTADRQPPLPPHSVIAAEKSPGRGVGEAVSPYSRPGRPSHIAEPSGGETSEAGSASTLLTARHNRTGLGRGDSGAQPASPPVRQGRWCRRSAGTGQASEYLAGTVIPGDAMTVLMSSWVRQPAPPLPTVGHIPDRGPLQRDR